MTQTRYDKKVESPGILSSGYEGSNVTRDFSVPSCGIEDVDRAFFELFDKVLPLTYKASKDSDEIRKIPIVFASGERFALASKKSPLRDKSGSLILPIISISRSGVEQTATKGMGVSEFFNEMVVKRRISDDDPLWQAIQNSRGLKNTKGPGAGVLTNAEDDYYTETGRLLQPDLKKGLYETIVIPMPKYFTVKYDITFWAQYVGQLNNMMTTLLGAYINGHRTIKITTKKGYWFVAYFDQAFSSGNNFDSFSEDERLVKATISAEVPGYLVLPQIDGIPNGVRSFISAPTISFGAYIGDTTKTQETPIASGKVNPFILSDVATDENVRPSASVGEDGKIQAEFLAGADREDASGVFGDIKGNDSAVGNVGKIATRTRKVVYDKDPITGKPGKVIGKVTDAVPQKGEQTISIESFAKL